MLRVSSGFFRSSRPCRDSTGSAVITDVVCRVNDYGLVVCVVKVPATDIVHVCVVAELIVTPVAALIADPAVAEAIVDAAVEADLGTPIALIPRIPAIAPTPITRGPQVAHSGWLDPSAGHPEVALVAIAPVTGRPEITFLRTNRLRVYDQFRRRDRDGDADLGERLGRYGQHYKQERQKTNRAESAHLHYLA